MTLGALALRQQAWQSLPYLHHTQGPKLTFSEYDLPDYLTFLKNQQAEMERVDKIATEGMALNRLKIRIIEATTDEDTARRVYIAKTNGITIREQKDIEQEAKRHREDAHVQSDGYAPSDIDLPDDTVLCLASTRKACQEALSKIVSCPNSEPDTTSENTSASSQEGTQDAPEGEEDNHTGTGEDGSVATASSLPAVRLCWVSSDTGEDGPVATAADSTTDNLALAAEQQKRQQTDSDSDSESKCVRSYTFFYPPWPSQKYLHLPADQRPFECQFEGCEYSTHDRRKMQRHVGKYHTPSYTNDMLCMVMRHGKHEIHRCKNKGCDYATTDLRCLKEHEWKKHSTVLIFDCKHKRCNYRTKSLCHLKRHKQTLHPADQ